MVAPRVLICFAAVALLAAASVRSDDGVEAAVESAVLTLDAANFSDAIAKHPFIVVEFYAPWCGHCKSLAPEYEKAASVLSKHDPPIVLAKVDANDEANKELAKTYKVEGFPTIKIVRNEGKIINEYDGPRDAEGIVQYLKRQLGPASSEIKSLEEATSLINDQNFFIAGVFPEYSGEEFENFLLAAEKLRTEYSFGYTLDAKFLPLGDSTIKGPTIRLFKPFDELFVDSQDFHFDALAKFIEESTMPLVVTFDTNPSNQPFLQKFFTSDNNQVMLFVDFGNEKIEAFKSKYQEVAELYKGTDLSFLIGDVNASNAAIEYFGLKEGQAPLIIVDGKDKKKYLKEKVEPDHILTWIKEYKDGSVTPFIKSEPIPEVNNEPVKVVVYDSLHEVVFNSKKNVLLEFYAPWCGHCKQLAPILEEVAVSFKDDADVIIAKMDATANDVPAEFEVEGFPTLYFSSASGKLLKYDEGRTAEDIIEYIQKNKDAITKIDSEKDEL